MNDDPVSPPFASLPIFSHLSVGLWHRTSVAGLSAIYADGWLRPSAQDSPNPWRNSSARSYATKNGYIAVFDFESAAAERVEQQIGNALSILLDDGGASVLIGIDRSSVLDDLVPAATLQPFDPQEPQHIPWLEAWIAAPVPISKFREIIVLSSIDPYPFEICRAQGCPLDSVDCAVSRFEKAFDHWKRNTVAGRVMTALQGGRTQVAARARSQRTQSSEQCAPTAREIRSLKQQD